MRAPTAVAPAVGCGAGGAGVGCERGERPRRTSGRRALRSVEEAGDVEDVAGPRGEARPGRPGRPPTAVDGPSAVGQGDERHHVDGAQPGVHPAVGGEVDGVDGRGGHRPGRRLDVGQRAAEGQDRAVVVRVGVDVEEAVAAGRRHRGRRRRGHVPR